MQTLWQDLKFALRMLKRNPGFTAVALLTLALGIGANTVIFSVVNAVLLRPFPYSDPARLLAITQTERTTGRTGGPMSFTKFSAIVEQSNSLESAATAYPRSVSLVSDREPELVNAARVSQDFFHVLGVPLARGRAFLREEEVPGGNDVAVISDAFWHNHFAGDAGVIGKSLFLDGKSVSVVGILPASFRFPLYFPEPDVWLPRVFDPSFLRAAQVQSGAGYLSMIARMRSGETIPRVQAGLAVIDARYTAQFGSYVDASKFALTATSFEEQVVGPLRKSLLVLLAAVGFILLIACANVANLLLARATSRDREMAIRKSLGASRWRLVRQLLSESTLLALGGGALGVVVTGVLLPGLRTLTPGTIPRVGETRIDGAVLVFSLLLCGLTGILFGLMPSLQAAGKELQQVLRGGGHGSSQGKGGRRFRAALVVAEIGMALVLMTGAGLLMESFARLMNVNPGLSAKNVMTFPLALPTIRYPKPELQEAFYRQLLERVRTLPSVQSAAVTSNLPFLGNVSFGFFCPEGTVCRGIGKDPVTATRQVSPGYFATIQTALLNGRVFTEGDTAGGHLVAIVNKTTAERYWPGQNALGKHVANSRDMIPREIVGVVADVKFQGLNVADSEELYVPMAQIPSATMTLLVRSSGSSPPLVSAVREEIAELDANLAVSGISSMEEVIAGSVAQPRLIMQFVGVFAGFALLLAAIGIYGVMAYSVNARKQEMGIRVALGAKPANILRLVVGQGMRMTLTGVALGVVISLGLTRLLASLLFGVRSSDPLAFGAAAFVLVGTAFLACCVPGWRATRADPIAVLRCE